MSTSERRCSAGQARRVVSWIGWHLGELFGVLVPAALALWVTPWAAVVSAAAGAAWMVHEIHLARRPVTADRSLSAVESAQSEEDAPAAGSGGAR